MEQIEFSLREALTRMGFKNDELFLEVTESGKVAGHIVSPLFSGKTQEKRQDDLWRGLEHELSPAELRHVLVLLTATPQEVADDIAA